MNMKGIKLLIFTLTCVILGVALDQLYLDKWLFDKDKKETVEVLDSDSYQMGTIKMTLKGKDSVNVNGQLDLPIQQAKEELFKLTSQQLKNYVEAKDIIKAGKPLLDSANIYYKEVLGFDLVDSLKTSLLPAVKGIYQYDDNIVRVNNKGFSEDLQVKPSLFADEIYFKKEDSDFVLYEVEKVNWETNDSGQRVATEIIFKSTKSESTISKLLNI